MFVTVLKTASGPLCGLGKLLLLSSIPQASFVFQLWGMAKVRLSTLSVTHPSIELQASCQLLLLFIVFFFYYIYVCMWAHTPCLTCGGQRTWVVFSFCHVWSIWCSLKKKIFFFQTDEDGKTILNLENSNKSLSGELREVKKDLGQLQENLEVSENMNLQFENQLNKTLRNLSTVMDDIHTVLKKVRWFVFFMFSRLKL